jgi:hypothetical protein
LSQWPASGDGPHSDDLHRTGFANSQNVGIEYRWADRPTISCRRRQSIRFGAVAVMAAQPKGEAKRRTRAECKWAERGARFDQQQRPHMTSLEAEFRGAAKDQAALLRGMSDDRRENADR